VKKFVKKGVGTLRQKIRKFLQIPPNYVGDNGCIRAAATYIAANQIEGDYLEFGVWRGYSFAPAFHAITRNRKNHFELGYDTAEYLSWKNNDPHFYAFDSFEGLPGGESEKRMADYDEGSYACSEKDFLQNLSDREVDMSKVTPIKGFYDKTCSDETKRKHNIKKVAVVMIDCDLYESTVPVLKFLTDVVQQGTIIIFDDWFRFQGNPQHGEQLACKEWLESNPHFELIEFWRQGPQAVSFIVNMKQK